MGKLLVVLVAALAALLVAQNSGATSFAVARLSADEVVVPEPGSLDAAGAGADRALERNAPPLRAGSCPAEL